MPNIVETGDAAASAATSYTLGIGQTAQGQLSTGADHDWFRVNLVAGQTYSFALTGTGTNNVTDTYLRLIGVNGVTQVAFDNDGLEGQNSLITFTVGAGQGGTYFLDAGSNDASPGQYGLSATLGLRASFDAQMGAGVIDTDESWSPAPGTGATVTYGFRESPATYTVDGSDISTFAQVTAAEIAAVQSMLQMYSEFAGIAFSRVNPAGTTDDATILFANYTDANDGAGAFASYPGSTDSTDQAGDVWINTNSVSTSSLPFGSYSFFAVMHEIGHAVGLSHPGLYNAEPGIDLTYAANAQFIQDTQQYSIMSYFDETETGATDYNEYPDTPMLFDIYALQQIYGANMTTRTGNTVYGFGSTAGAVYNFAVNTNPALCIYDAGGNDTLNCSGFGSNQVISLTEGVFSNIGALEKNVSIALGAVIENAVGGSGNDNISGNAAANSLNGGLGNDTMAGGAGNDTYVVGSTLDVTSEAGGSGIDTILSAVSRTLDSGFEKLTMIGTAGITGIGNTLNNTLTGNSGNNFLNGSTGNDTMIGGAGNDSYVVGSVGDVTLETGGSGTDRVVSAVNRALGTGLENLTLIGGATLAIGNTVANVIIGTAGANSLHGREGNDTINGGGGADGFIFGTALNAATNVDVIQNFSTVDDIVGLEDTIFIQVGPSLIADEFVNATAAQDAEDRIVYNSATGALFYDADGLGAVNNAIRFATLSTGLALSHLDFQIV